MTHNLFVSKYDLVTFKADLIWIHFLLRTATFLLAEIQSRNFFKQLFWGVNKYSCCLTGRSHLSISHGRWKIAWEEASIRTMCMDIETPESDNLILIFVSLSYPRLVLLLLRDFCHSLRRCPSKKVDWNLLKFTSFAAEIFTQSHLMWIWWTYVFYCSETFSKSFVTQGGFKRDAISQFHMLWHS